MSDTQIVFSLKNCSIPTERIDPHLQKSVWKTEIEGFTLQGDNSDFLINLVCSFVQTPNGADLYEPHPGYLSKFYRNI